MSDEPEKVDLRSLDVAEEKRRQLLRLFPEVRTEGGKIDFDRLKLTLGEMVDVGRERYGMNWPGKADCFRTIQAPSTATLRPCREESVNFDTTENLIIEGDNLEVLKLLQKSYLGKVKMIYIDPPYNTGNDFIYPDNYSESLQTYLEYTGQVDAAGKKFGTNPDTDGRFHSKWLNMMYPRLYLARNLLRDNGVIFVSVDDQEVDNLRKLCNEVFGENAFIAQLVWKSRVSEDTRATTGVSTDHEYILCYGAAQAHALRGTEKDIEKFSNPDNDPRGLWRSADLTGLATKDARPNLHYDLVNPATGVNYGCPPKGWRFDPSTMARKTSEERIIWPNNTSGRPRHKLFLNELRSRFKNISSVVLKTSTAEGTRELNAMFDEQLIQFPKPTALLRLLLAQATGDDDLVVDFFAGTGTTGHAVIKANQDDGGNRRFILVQLPEFTGRNDYRTIADITKERLRRAVRNASNTQTPEAPPDHNLGFRVFTLAESNLATWSADARTNVSALEHQLELHIQHVKAGRSSEDLLFEILLKEGYPPATRIEELPAAGKTTFSAMGGVFLMCLERELTIDAIRAMADLGPQRVVCLDEGFAGNDQLKANAVQIFKSKGIVFRTV